MEIYTYNTKKLTRKTLSYKYTIKLLTDSEGDITSKVIRTGYSQNRDNAKIRAIRWIKRYKKERSTNLSNSFTKK